MRAAAAILRRERGVTDRWRFPSIELREPAKPALREHPPGDPIARSALVVCWNRDDGAAYKAVVSLTENRVVSWEQRPGEQPNMTDDEFHEADAAMRRDPRVREALARRGIIDLDRVPVDTWAYAGSLVPKRYRDRRVGWCDVWYRAQEGSNPYANKVTGLHPILDLNRMELLEVQDSGAVAPAPVMGEHVPRLVPGLRLRDDLRPLEVRQPEGVSFTLDGHLLPWQRWSLRIGFNSREGARPAHGRLRGLGPRALGGAPDVVRRDGRAVPRSQPGARAANRVRHRRMGPGVHDHVA